MSEIRIPDIVWRWGNAAAQGKKSLRIELYSAEQWRRNWNPYRKTMHPHPLLRTREYWNQYYRLRVDGRWLGKAGYKYTFFTLVQAVELAGRLLAEKK